MFKKFFRKVHHVLVDPELRRRILFVLGALVVFRLLATIPIPGVNPIQLEQFFQTNQFLQFLNFFSGGGLANLSIVMLGVGPYITASIIMQLMSIMSPRIKALYTEEGEAGRQKFTQYGRLLSVPLAFVQAFGFLMLLTSQGVVDQLSFFPFLVNVTIVAAGSVLVYGESVALRVSLLPPGLWLYVLLHRSDL
jgi:preprotein translocase subunit SecY